MAGLSIYGIDMTIENYIGYLSLVNPNFSWVLLISDIGQRYFNGITCERKYQIEKENGVKYLDFLLMVYLLVLKC